MTELRTQVEVVTQQRPESDVMKSIKVRHFLCFCFFFFFFFLSHLVFFMLYADVSNG